MPVWTSRGISASASLAGLLAGGGLILTVQAKQAPATASTPTTAPHLALVEDYCVTCHDEEEKKGGLSLETVSADVSQHPEVWEKVVRKLRARQMPPVGRKERPDEATYDSTIR